MGPDFPVGEVGQRHTLRNIERPPHSTVARLPNDDTDCRDPEIVFSDKHKQGKIMDGSRKQDKSQ